MTMARQIAALQRLTVKELRTQFGQVFGAATNAHNRDWLIRRIAWRLQANAEGGLSERALARAAELADEADLRVVPPRQPKAKAPEPKPDLHIRSRRQDGDDRLPPPGTILTRKYKGDTLQVKVLTQGFEFEGREFSSLSALARAITGSRNVNGFLFFRLTRSGGQK